MIIIIVIIIMTQTEILIIKQDIIIEMKTFEKHLPKTK